MSNLVEAPIMVDGAGRQEIQGCCGDAGLLPMYETYTYQIHTIRNTQQYYKEAAASIKAAAAASGDQPSW